MENEGIVPVEEVVTSKKEEEVVKQRFEDPRNCNSLEDLIGRSDDSEVKKLRRIDWVPRKLDVSRIADVVKLVQERKKDASPLKIVDVGGLNGFLGRLILDDLDQKSSGNVVLDVVDPNKTVMDYAQKYYELREPRLKFIPEKAEEYVNHSGFADVVICSWMRPEMNLRPTIERLKPEAIIFVKDISGDAGQPQAYIDNDGYKQTAAWLGFSGHNIDAIRDGSGDESFIDNVVLIMTTDDISQGKIKEVLSGKSIGEKYPWESELPVTNKGLRIHDRDDFDMWVQDEND